MDMGNIGKEKECVFLYRQKQGAIRLRLTNDYLFRALMQMNENVCKSLIGSLLHLQPEQVISTKIENPIELGKSIDEKEFFLDVKVSLNSSTIVNLEMQVINEYNWEDRSVLYLCRAFDHINKGADYLQVHPVVQISLLDFSLPKQLAEFYASYQLMNTRTHEVYNDKLKLCVMELKQRGLATEEDKAWNLDTWAGFFKATTWEEIKALAHELPVINEAAETIYQISQDEKIRQQCEAREEYYRLQRTKQLLMEMQDKKMKEQDEKLQQQGEKIQQQGEKIQQQDTTIQLQAAKLNEKDTEIQRLKDLLANANRVL